MSGIYGEDNFEKDLVFWGYYSKFSVVQREAWEMWLYGQVEGRFQSIFQNSKIFGFEFKYYGCY